MLAVTTYPQTYVDECKKRIRADVRAFKVATDSVSSDEKPRERLNTVFFSTLLMVVDAHFAHRLRTNELKDDNPLNEVRVLVRSLLEN